jgi:hypothetical protein
MKKVMPIFGAILFAATILTSCNSTEKSNSTEKTTKEQKTKSVKCGYCNAELYEGQPAVGLLSAPGKYFCNETCSEMYSVYGSK